VQFVKKRNLSVNLKRQKNIFFQIADVGLLDTRGRTEQVIYCCLQITVIRAVDTGGGGKSDRRANYGIQRNVRCQIYATGLSAPVSMAVKSRVKPYSDNVRADTMLKVSNICGVKTDRCVRGVLLYGSLIKL